MDSLNQAKQAWDQQLKAYLATEKQAQNAAATQWYLATLLDYVRIEENRAELLRWANANSNKRDAVSATCSLAEFTEKVLHKINSDINYTTLNNKLNGVDLARAMDSLWRQHSNEQELHYKVGPGIFTVLNKAFLIRCQQHFEESAAAARSKYTGCVRQDVARLYLERFAFASATTAQAKQFRAAVEQLISNRAVLSKESIIEATEQRLAAPKAGKKRSRRELNEPDQAIIESAAAALDLEASYKVKIQQLERDLAASTVSADAIIVTKDAALAQKDVVIEQKEARLLAVIAEKDREIAALRAQLEAYDMP